LERIKTLVDGGWQRDIIAQMGKARKMVARLTPKSKEKPEGRKHLRDGWTLKTIGRGGKDRVPVLSVVYNRLTHKPTGAALPKAMLKSKKDRTTREETVLEILEYGSRPHVIEAIDAKALRFKWLGNLFFAKRVQHPGTKAHGMVRTTRVKMIGWLRKLNARWARKLGSAWRG
jgi:hypothetical protein